MTLRRPSRGPRTPVGAIASLATLLAMSVLAPACGGSRSAGPPIPAVSFLVAAGDSTFWVERDRERLTVRRSPMLLAELGGQFHELYLTDDDRSYFDAVILGQRIYRRDLVTGDSLLLHEDATIARLAAEYAARHPGAIPLAPDEDAAQEPAMHATTETELLDVAGPFLTIEQHVDIDAVGDRDEHVTRRGVIDVRDGHAVTLADLVGARQAQEVHRQGQRLLEAALDSVRRANDERARRATTALTGFVFDSMSFALVDDEGGAAIAFLVPGRGPRAGGFALPLPPIRIPGGPWWTPIQAGLPSLLPDGATWRGPGYEVVAREDSTGESAQLLVRAGPNEWAVARVPAPVRRVRRLDQPSIPATTLEALRRAFSESALYSGETRTASRPDQARPAVARASHCVPDRRWPMPRLVARAAPPTNRRTGSFFPLMPRRPPAFLHAGQADGGTRHPAHAPLPPANCTWRS